MNNRQAPTRFLIDEFPALRDAPFILNAMATKRGHGVTFHLMLQALSQAKHSYKDGWEQILGLSAVIQYFGGTADPLTAETISKELGPKTIPTIGGSQNPGQSSMGNTYGLAGRSLQMPDEVMRFAMPDFIAYFVGKGPVIGRLIDPSLRDFQDYQLFMQGIKDGNSPDICAKSVWGMIEYREKRARAAAQPAPSVPAPKSSLARRLLDRFTTKKRKPARPAKPHVDGEEWFDRIIRKIMGHESQ